MYQRSLLVYKQNVLHRHTTHSDVNDALYLTTPHLDGMLLLVIIDMLIDTKEDRIIDIMLQCMIYETVMLYLLNLPHLSFIFFFLKNPAPPEISPLPLHAPLPILLPPARWAGLYSFWLMNRWLAAPKLEGPWAALATPPASLGTAKQAAVQSGQVDLLDKPAP